MEIYLIILILALVQSLFGVGLLLFGTPILLILSYDYHEALLFLLPASAAISFSQLWDHRSVKLDGHYRSRFFLFCIPALLLGMVWTSKMDLNLEVRLIVMLMLATSFLIRSQSQLRLKLETLLRKQLPGALIFMGLVHGMANMGGSILTPLVSSLYSDKKKILAGISFDYAIMASLQLLMLTLFSGHSIELKHILGAILALFIRLMIGKRVFLFTQERMYQRCLNGFILANFIVLLISI